MKSCIMDQWDLNHDGKINKAELTMLLLQQGRLCLEEEEEFRIIEGEDED